MKFRADLHTHTYYSDGVFSPEGVAKEAKDKGIKILAVTDHDTMNGYTEKRFEAEKHGLIFIDGLEISAYRNAKIHVLGYNVDPESNAYLDFCRQRVEGALSRTEDIIKKLRKNYNIFISFDDVLNEIPVEGAPVHTMYIARAVAKKGYFSDGEQVYEKCLSIGKGAYSDVGRPTPEQAVEVIHASGGIACLAHPQRIDYSPDGRLSLIKSLKDRGLDGIEAEYFSHTPEETVYYKKIAKAYSLLVTGGSDCHGNKGKRNYHELGRPEFYPEDDLLEALKIKI